MKKYLLLLSTICLFNISCKEEIETEENEEYENPAARYRQEFNKTYDPNLGIIPAERMYAAIDQAIAQQNTFTTEGVTGVWTERGPSFDSVGISNGNGRGGGNGVTQGYASGRIKAICIDKSDATGNTVITAGVNGGMWKCTNYLNTAQAPNWTPISDYLNNITFVSICQNPANLDIMYAATGEAHDGYENVRGNGLYKSTDHGLTWTPISGTNTVQRSFKIVCDAAGNVYWATYGSGLRRSTNGGTSWTSISPSGTGTACTDIEFTNSGKMHVSMGYRTGTVYYRTTAAPATVASGTWTNTTITGIGSSFRLELATSGDVVYGLTATTGGDLNFIFKSTDAGATWVKMNPANTIPLSASSGAAVAGAGQAWYGVGLAVNPTDPNTIIFGVLDGWISNDGGATFFKATYWRGSTPYVHADYHNIEWINIAGSNKMYIATDGGMFLSDDDGTTFKDRNKGLNIKQFYSCAIHPTNPNYFLAGAQDNGSHQFRYTGLASTREVTGGDGGYCAIDQDQTQFQFTSYTNNIFFRSTNGGNTWGQVPLNGNTGSFINPWEYDNDENYIISGNNSTGDFLRWTNPQTGNSNSAVTLSELGSNSNGFGDAALGCVTFSPYTTGRAFLGGSGSGVVIRLENAKTTTGSGSADVNVITPSGANGTNVNCIAVGTNDNNLIACYSNYGVSNVWFTSDGGTTWAACDGNLPDLPVKWAVFHPTKNTAAVIATEIGVYYTTNLNGASTVWVRSAGLPFTKVDMIKLRKSDNLLIAATHGRGLWSTNILDLLPLKNININGLLKGENMATINWNMVDATDKVKFVLEYSEDGINFKTIARGSKEISSYSYAINKEVGYFRVMGFEPGSSPIYSKVVALKSNKISKGLQINIAPNPITAAGKISIQSTTASHYDWKICNVQGCVVQAGSGKLNNVGIEFVNYNYAKLANGMYLIKVTQNGVTKIVNFLK